MKIAWSRDALRDLDEKFAFLETRDPAAARAMVLAIRAAVRDLGTAPERWPVLPGTDLRKRTAGNYIILYRSREGVSVEIARIYHAREDWLAR